LHNYENVPKIVENLFLASWFICCISCDKMILKTYTRKHKERWDLIFYCRYSTRATVIKIPRSEIMLHIYLLYSHVLTDETDSE